MRIKKEQLRWGARAALAEQGFSQIELAPGPGIVPGARLHAVQEGKQWRIAVRTSSDREVGLLRTPNGNWRTINNVDLVLVAAPTDDAPAIDVFAFEPNILLQVFETTVLAREENNRDKARFKIPIFVPLDDVKKSKTRDARQGLKARAVWQVQVPIGRLSSRPPTTDEDHRARFLENIKRHVADFVGVDVSKIELEIRIKP
jgi:hypothetical protein